MVQRSSSAHLTLSSSTCHGHNARKTAFGRSWICSDVWRKQHSWIRPGLLHFDTKSALDWCGFLHEILFLRVITRLTCLRALFLALQLNNIMGKKHTHCVFVFFLSLALFPSLLLCLFFSPIFSCFLALHVTLFSLSHSASLLLNMKPYLIKNTSRKQASPTTTRMDTAMPAITAVSTLPLSLPLVRTHVGVSALLLKWYPLVQTHSKLPGVFLHSLFISSKQSCFPCWHSSSSRHTSPSCPRL